MLLIITNIKSMEKRHIIHFEGIYKNQNIKGYYSEKQPSYEWSFTDDINKAKRFKDLHTLNGFIKHQKECLYKNLKSNIIDIFIRPETIVEENDQMLDANSREYQLGLLRSYQHDMDIDIRNATYNWSIVKNVLLGHTSKGGRTSSYKHCEFLGINPDGKTFY